MKPNWQRVTDVQPENGQECLVWNGHYMYISTAHFYNLEAREMLGYDAKIIEMWKNDKGYFVDYSQKNYFNDPNVFWAPIPEAPDEEDLYKNRSGAV